MVDEDRFSVLGGEADTITGRLEESWRDDLDLTGALRAAVAALGGPDRSLPAAELEVAVLARSNGRRKFARIEGPRLEELLAT